MIDQLIESAVILDNLEATRKSDALPEILRRTCDAGKFAKTSLAALRKKVEEREALGSTGIGNGVAVPHVKAPSLKEPWLAVARSLSGLEFEAIDGRPVHTVFLLGSPASMSEEHLQCLRWISTVARNADFRRFMLDAASEDAIRDLLREMHS